MLNTGCDNLLCNYEHHLYIIFNTSVVFGTCQGDSTQKSVKDNWKILILNFICIYFVLIHINTTFCFIFLIDNLLLCLQKLCNFLSFDSGLVNFLHHLKTIFSDKKIEWFQCLSQSVLYFLIGEHSLTYHVKKHALN